MLTYLFDSTRLVQFNGFSIVLVMSFLSTACHLTTYSDYILSTILSVNAVSLSNKNSSVRTRTVHHILTPLLFNNKMDVRDV